MQFFNTYVTSGGGHEDESMYDVVMHHLTDHVLTGGFIGRINELYLNEKIFGIFDMRITKWVVMLWISLLLMALVFIPLGRKIKKAQMGSKSRWVNMWEALIGFVHDEIVEPNFDHKYIKKAMPYFLTVFFYILFCNFAGLFLFSYGDRTTCRDRRSGAFYSYAYGRCGHGKAGSAVDF
jgi:F-type H+-transporting ATPase subunit a